jgi:hypothetical protein
MISSDDIPREALDIRYSNRGSFEHVELHHRNGLYFQESSYSHFWFFGVMLAAAGVALLLPWETRAIVGKLKHWVAGILVWGGICGFVPYFIRNACGQRINVDPHNMTLRIASSDFSGIVSWQQIIGLQICHQKVPGDSRLSGFQLNLVWAEAGGAVRRHCLLKHSIMAFVVRLGKHYESLFAFPLIDHTRGSE